MKVLNKTILVIMVLLLLVSCKQRVKYNPESDFSSEPIDGGRAVRITRYTGSEWTANIPPRIQNLPVTEIGNSAFEHRNLISVTIPNSVTTIGHRAFANNQLTQLTIPNSVTTIGSGAFGVNQLTQVTIGNSVTMIRSLAFINNQLSQVTIPNSVTEIEDRAFDENVSIIRR